MLTYRQALENYGTASYAYASNMTDENFQNMILAQNQLWQAIKDDIADTEYREYQASLEPPEFPNGEFPFR